MTTGALVTGTVVLWRMLPVPWRPAATMVCLGFAFLPSYARLGYPAILALVLLIPVVVRWPRIGLGAGSARRASRGPRAWAPRARPSSSPGSWPPSCSPGSTPCAAGSSAGGRRRW